MKKNKSKKKGQDFEKKIIKTLNSGALWFNKTDATSENECFEIKFTDKGSYRITNKVLEKLWVDSLETNKLPRLIVGISRNEKELFILSCNLEIRKK